MLATLEHAVRVHAANAVRRSSPLDSWHIAVPRLREALGMLAGNDPADELLMLGPNKGTKTETLASFALHCLQKRLTIDGVPLPQWRGPLEAAQLVLDYTQQILSVQPAYLRLLGDWPYKARWKGEILSSLHVMPIGGGDDESKWSVIHFLSQDNKRAGLGVRGDLILFDEPPVIEILRELRKAAHAGRRCVTAIGCTPTIRSQWADLKLDYGQHPRRSLVRVDPERVQVRWSLNEVANWVLSPAEKAKLRRKYATDPLREAREHGDYIDASGSCPFHIPTLMEMLEQCREPELVGWRITREVDGEEGRTRVVTTIPIEIWEPACGRSCYIPCDPSSGVNDDRFDPGGLHVGAMGSGDLLLRFNGRIGSYGLGVLAAGIARQYNGAVVDPETTGGWGEGVLRGLADSHYGNVAKARRELSPGKWHTELGFKTTHSSRGAMIAAIQGWIEAWRAGIRYGSCPSRAVIQCLLDTVLDEDGKAAAAPGFHDEDLILTGQRLRRCCTSTGVVVPEVYRSRLTAEQKLGRLITGKDEDEEMPEASYMVPRVRR